MSLIRQIWLLVLGIIVFALVGSAASTIWTARGYLQTQLALKNSDNAQSLAMTLSQQGGDIKLIELAMAAQFDIGHYRSIRLKDTQGGILFEREAALVETGAPHWFMHLVAIESIPGVAQVSSGWAALGSVVVISEPVFAYAELWKGAWTNTAWMLLVGVVAALIAHLAVGRLRRPLDETVAQAQALSQRHYMTIAEPRTPELRDVSRAMNQMVERVRLQFNEQATQVDELRRRANGDALTGVSHRAHFMSCLQSQLAHDDRSIDGQLILIRVLGLADLNLTKGHLVTDTMLKLLVHRFEEPVGNSMPDLVGRLNGSDFAILFSHDAAFSDTAVALMDKVRGCVAGYPGVSLVMSTARLLQTDTMAALMSRIDAGLACAEARGDFSIEFVEQADLLAKTGGEVVWRQSICEALEQGRVRLGNFAVVDRSGRRLHTECPLRLQMRVKDDYQVAATWLPHAMRTGLVSDIDACAIDLALRAIALDQQPRCINISPRSLCDSSFLSRIVARLGSDPHSASQLWVDVDASILPRHTSVLSELCSRLRPMGVRVGIEHVDERMATSNAVFDAGIDYIKLSQTLSLDIAAHPARQSLLKGIVSVLHGLGVAVYAEGLRNEADVTGCWECGIDGVTGPAV